MLFDGKNNNIHVYINKSGNKPMAFRYVTRYLLNCLEK